MNKKREELENGVKEIANPSLNDYYEHFTKMRRHEVKESTIRSQDVQYRAIANTEIAEGTTFGDLHIQDITRRNIETVRNIMLEAGKTPQYLNNCFAHLNHVFNSAVLDDTILKNPCKSLKQLRRTDAPIGENKHRALSEIETEKFFHEAAKRNSYYLNLYKLMIATGLRIGEATALFPMDIDRKNGFIHVRRTITRNEVGGYEVGQDAKTKSGVRDIPLTDEVYKIIVNQRTFNKMFHGTDTGLLFPNVEGGILREYTANREIKRICKAAGVEYFTCHAFRNTFATRFIEQAPDDYKILSEILGHKDIAITLNLYTHVMTENKVRAMNEIRIKTV